MDTRLLRHYEEELDYIREMGAEFSEAYPKIASRLGMKQIEVLDPYVERLLEGFAFLSARVQLELQMQYPAFTQNLLEIVYPHFLAPTPSMTIVRLTPDAAQGGISEGYTVPRGTTLRGRLLKGETTACQFTTSQDVTLWPIELAEVEYVEGRSELVAAGLAKGNSAKAAIRLRIRRNDGGPLSELPLDTLTLYLSGAGSEPWRLYEALTGKSAGIAGRSTNRREDWTVPLGQKINARGFEPEEALLPVPGQSFEGYRLLQEYFAMPQRFFFVDLAGLRPALSRAAGDDLDLYVLLTDEYPALKAIGTGSFEFHAVPAINLFTKRCDRVHISGTEVDHHVTVDRMAPLDYEIYQLNEVVGISGDGTADTAFRPFYSSQDFTPHGDSNQAYYAVRRRLRQRSEKQRLKGGRTSYLGTDIFLSLCDRSQAPYPGDVQQLAVTAICTNRDLPLLTPIGTGETDFVLPDGGPVSEVRAIVPPTRPNHCLADGSRAWQLVSHLSLNYLSIADADRGSGASALKELIGLYTPLGEAGSSKQMEGLLSVTSRPVVRRISGEVLSTAVRGLEVRVGVDETCFEGAGCYLFGAVLENFFAKYVALNSFTETVLHSKQRGDIARWPARSGKRILI
ncbi:type VI secretion system baseplate subunit TssF [Roseibium sp. RKSG952]|uniref:type VI secretion system baseplate subunit TssF n=1 Tax=Roseibium sp. RKSG952 TaxID=2529384 RepID=UPI0012BD323D|nr:type VI secretion system baseplate subunit TssF [Roseibium sp. RKSG952]MTI00411.1 type VI secretion system baseplate subunit TssF [Roseibium sp. RKSG952]